MFNILRREPGSFLHATNKERYNAIERLISSATLSKGYYLLLVLSALIVTPGILIHNTPVVIGGMILAPLIIPILSLSLSLVAGNIRGIFRSLAILLMSIMTIIVISALLTYLFARAYNVIEWIPDDIDSGVYVFIAFCSGVAAAFAWVKEDLAPTIAGVAIAVSLLPPLCAAGISLALAKMLLLQNSLILFTANFLGISVAAFLVFWILGFLEYGHIEEKVIKKQDKK
jgi:uncharacterized hydrophobic protein (TIGR00341 family)